AELRDASVAEAAKYPKSAVMPGVTRGAVIELAAKEKIGVNLASINVTQWLEADEVFITNSIMGIMPVCRVERKAIGADKPGAVTLKLMEGCAAAVERRA